jgi:hypothetical protein
MGSAAATYSLPLLANEKVLQVSWQALQQELKEPRSCAAAVLTTHRIMIVSGDLKLITSAAAGGGALAAVHGITSMCWAGPALLYATVLGEWPRPRVLRGIMFQAVACALYGSEGICPRMLGPPATPQPVPHHECQQELNLHKGLRLTQHQTAV